MQWLETRESEGLVLTAPPAVSWITGGRGPAVDRSAGVDTLWVALGRKGAALITTDVEADRIRDEYGPGEHGFDELICVPWFSPVEFVRAAESFLDAPAETLEADGHHIFGRDASEDLASLRLSLSDSEVIEMRELGLEAALALEGGLMEWRPGETDLNVQARIESQLTSRGIYAVVSIVGGDARVERYRHPVAVGAPISRLVMGVIVASREGLHVACTRFAATGALDAEFEDLMTRVRSIDGDVLKSCEVGRSYGSVLERLDEAYARVGFPGGWRGHYQGGPIGFQQREFEIAPSQIKSRWFSQEIEASHALAWNPSLPGGAKVEDTYLVTGGALEPVTRSQQWPLQRDASGSLGHPAVLSL